MIRPRSTLPVAALLLAATAGGAAAQSLRDLTVARHRTDQRALDVDLQFASGGLQLRPATGHTLYRMQLTYDPGRFLPLTRFLEGASSVRLGVESTGRTGLHVRSGRDLSQMALVELSPAVDLSLAIGLSSTEAELELGGLRVTMLALRTGAGRTTLRFSQPNPAPCASATITAEAAEITAEGLGNARCRRVLVEGDVGTLTLDFSGVLPDSMHVSVEQTVGGVTLRLPKHAGIRLTMSRFLASFDSRGFIRAGEAFVTEGYETAARRLDIELRAAVGGVTVVWLP